LRLTKQIEGSDVQSSDSLYCLLATICGAASLALSRSLTFCRPAVSFFNLLLQFLYFTMFLEKFIKQHRVHCVVADGVWFSFFIAHYQARIDCFDDRVRVCQRLRPWLISFSLGGEYYL
jgi:hypothetical protein